MLTLISATFSMAKGALIAVAAVNAVVLAGALACLFFARHCAKKEQVDK